MTDDVPPPPFIFEGAETIEDVKSPAAGVSDTVKATAHRLSDAYDTARKPGMPLSILSNIAREAPLEHIPLTFTRTPHA
jgi:hypothetical protein